METIVLITEIKAPIKRCFSLSLSIDLHKHSTSKTGEKAIAGVTSGMIGLNETVTWKAKHFGIWQTLTTKITEVKEPHYFRDIMLQGAFRRMEHDHYFWEEKDKTVMEDRFVFKAPLGFLGRLAERLFLKKYLTRFLMERNRTIKEIAESEEWSRFLPEYEKTNLE